MIPWYLVGPLKCPISTLQYIVLEGTAVRDRWNHDLERTLILQKAIIVA